MVRNISEEELLLRKRARRRMLGAVTLVTLLVIFLPMIFDEESQQERQEIDIQIPSEDLVTENYPWMMPTDPAGDEIEPPTNQSDESLAMAPQSLPQIVEETQEESINNQGTPIPLTKPSYQKPVTQQVTKIQEGPQPKTDHAFVIQLGAFSDPLKAKQQLQNAFFITPVKFTKSKKFAGSLAWAPRWTRWTWSARRASRSSPRRPTACGTARASTCPSSTSTSSTRPGTSTSRSRSSARCACSTARSSCCAASPACSRSRSRSRCAAAGPRPTRPRPRSRRR